jgi:hypothetical protein
MEILLSLVKGRRTVNLPLFITKHHDMKACDGVEILCAQCSGQQCHLLYAWAQWPHYLLNRKLGRPQCRSANSLQIQLRNDLVFHPGDCHGLMTQETEAFLRPCLIYMSGLAPAENQYCSEHELT